MCRTTRWPVTWLRRRTRRRCGGQGTWVPRLFGWWRRRPLRIESNEYGADAPGRGGDRPGAARGKRTIPGNDSEDRDTIIVQLEPTAPEDSMMRRVGWIRILGLLCAGLCAAPMIGAQNPPNRKSGANAGTVYRQQP